MMIHGSANVAAGVGKMVATTIEANKNGSEAADRLNQSLPDSGLGMALYGVSGGNEKAGAAGDLVDIAVSLGLGAGASKAADTILDVAQTARKAGSLYTAEQKAVAEMAKKSTAAIVTDAIIETGNQINSAVSVKDNTDQLTQ